MNRAKVKSSSIESVGYDMLTQTLEIEFRFKSTYQSGSIYQYENFAPADWDKFIEAKSAGMHFDQFIKGKFPHKKIADAVQKENTHESDSAVDVG